MCYIQVKDAGKQIDFKSLDKAQKHNSDGYGCAWYEDGQVKTYKTFNYSTFKGVLKALKHYSVVAHLRYATKGNKEYSNLHPFEIPSGVMFHNGTIRGLGNYVQSDSSSLANLISKCDYKFIEDIEPLIEPMIDDKINRLVFFEDNGRITIMNKHLGIEDDGIWHSNDYHLKEEGWCRGGCTTPKVLPIKKHKVFVYGTLKRGYGNNSLLKEAVYLGKAKTIDKWSMVGKGRPFPYLLEKNFKGYNIEGEVYAVDDKELNLLDRLEGVPTHYRKEIIKVRYTDDGSLDTVGVYVKTFFNSTEVKDSDLISNWSR